MRRLKPEALVWTESPVIPIVPGAVHVRILGMYMIDYVIEEPPRVRLVEWSDSYYYDDDDERVYEYEDRTISLPYVLHYMRLIATDYGTRVAFIVAKHSLAFNYKPFGGPEDVFFPPVLKNISCDNFIPCYPTPISDYEESGDISRLIAAHIDSFWSSGFNSDFGESCIWGDYDVRYDGAHSINQWEKSTEKDPGFIIESVKSSGLEIRKGIYSTSWSKGPPILDKINYVNLLGKGGITL